MPGKQEIGVYAKAVYSLPEGCYGTELKDGKYTVTLPDGNTMTVTPDTPDSSLQLVVYPIGKSDEQAYKWFSDCAKDFGTNPLFYDIYFVDAYGNRTDLNATAKVSVALPKDYDTPKAAALSADGTLTPLEFEAENNMVSFPIEKNGYYVIAEKAPDVPPTGNPVFPQTGDNSNMLLWVALMTAAGCSMIFLLVFSKRKNKPNKDKQ